MEWGDPLSRRNKPPLGMVVAVYTPNPPCNSWSGCSKRRRGKRFVTHPLYTCRRVNRTHTHIHMNESSIKFSRLFLFNPPQTLTYRGCYVMWEGQELGRRNKVWFSRIFFFLLFLTLGDRWRVFGLLTCYSTPPSLNTDLPLVQSLLTRSLIWFNVN